MSGALRYDLGHAEIVQRDTVTSSFDLVPRDPKDGQFQGSDDGFSRTTLDTQSRQMFAERFELKRLQSIPAVTPLTLQTT